MTFQKYSCTIILLNVQTIEQKIKKGEKMIENKFSEYLGKRLIKIKDISNSTGISRTTLTSLYYKRSKRVSFETLDKLCGYLECTINDIVEYRN